MLKYFLLSISLCCYHMSIAQDKLMLKNGAQQMGYIVEKSEKKIRYKLTDEANSPIIVLKTEKVDRIYFRNGDSLQLPSLARVNRRFGVNAGLIYGLSEEAAFYKLGINYYLTPGIRIGFNGLIESEGGGGFEVDARYFFTPYNERKLKGYTGLIVGGVESSLFLQLPFGVNFVGDNGLDIGGGLRGFFETTNTSYSLYAELSVGYRF